MWSVLFVCLLTAVLGHAHQEVTTSWSNAVYYRILVDSFKDLDGDGLGDIPGVTKQLNYVRAVGADAVILSPLVPRSVDCSQPGTIHFTDIDSRYGNMEMFNSLTAKAKKLELSLLLTLPLQTVSTTSEWFILSANKTPGFENFVYWEVTDSDEPPPLIDGVTAWVWHDERNAYWASHNNESLLNLCSASLLVSFNTIICYWTKLGVSGFLLYPDFPMNYGCGIDMVLKMSVHASACAQQANVKTPIILIETKYDISVAAEYYGDGTAGANSVVSNALTSSTRKTAPDLALDIEAALLYTPQDMTPTWLTSSHQESRTVSRLGSEMADAINILSLILPGATIIQQGDELAAADTLIEWATAIKCWPNVMVPSAAPFPWDDSVTGSFTTTEPWMPLPPNYRYANAKTEFANEMSHLGVVRVLTAMKKTTLNSHTEIKRLNDVLAVLRWGGQGSVLVVSNIGARNSEIQLSWIAGLPADMTVAASSSGSRMSPGIHVKVDRILKLSSGETVLLVGTPRHCGGPGPIDKIASKLSEGWQKLNKYFNTK